MYRKILIRKELEICWPAIKISLLLKIYIYMTLRVFEAFSGVGSQRMALRDLGIDHEVVAISEIDKFAIQSYEAIHGPVNNLGDISKLEVADIPDHDLFTYSFPCQDISVAGRQNGLDEDSDTRSSLLWQCRKVIRGKKPKYLLLENVKNLVGKRHRMNFDLWLDYLEMHGYTNYWQVLNAKHYGIPQNRERVFVVSILGEHEPFEFPEPVELTTRLKDVLEDRVEDKFYLNNDKTRALLANLPERKSDEIKLHQLWNLEKVLGDYDGKFNDPQVGRVFDSHGVSLALDTMQGGNRQPKVLIKNATKKGYLTAIDGDGIDLAYPDSNTRRGRVQPQQAHTITTSDNLGTIEIKNPLKGKTDNGWHFEQAVYDSKGITRALKAGGGSGNIPKVITADGLYTNDSPRFHRGTLKDMSRTLKANKHDASVTDGYRIRKLTPLECWRLMGFTDDDFYKAQAVCSNSQLYKQAGNSIVKHVLMGIFDNLFK